MLSTNQKEVLLGEVVKYLEKFNVTSLLDIGPGDGTLAQQLANNVSRYLAVERNENFLKKLESLGLESVFATFPCPIEETFDMVLASHSLPEQKSLYKPFLDTAWKAVRPGGTFLIASLKGGAGALTKLKSMWRIDESEMIDKPLFDTMMDILNTYGEVTVHHTVSTLESDDYEEIVDFVLTSINPSKEKKQDCKRFLEDEIKSKYQKNGTYYFLNEHVFASVQKRLIP